MIELFFYLLLFYVVIILFLNFKYPSMQWDWDKISTDKIHFPPTFFWGTATAAHQVEGNCTNNWSQFENGIKSNGEPNIKDNQKSGIACDHWHRYKEDIQLIKDLGVKYYRFSVEWSKIEPTKGNFDDKVLQHYHDLIDELIHQGLTPVITLHHFTHPLWFDKLDGFEKSENIPIFVEFSKRVFSEYSGKVKYWCTINEPAVVASQGWFSGMFPPGKQNSQLSAVVLKNLLEAHVQSYHALKSMENGNKVEIGIVKNINQFDPWRRWNLMDWLISKFVNRFFNDSSIDFLKKGVFKIRIPGLAWIYHKNKSAVNSMDFFGLNYYSHNLLKSNIFDKDLFTLKYRDDDILTDMPYCIYGEGIYRAIQSVSVLNKPIIITENGIADDRDDRRALYIQRYLYAISKAIKDGYDVRGYYYWSLMDNFEWAFGYDMRFGLYEVDFNTQERKLREGAKVFVNIINSDNNPI